MDTNLQVKLILDAPIRRDEDSPPVVKYSIALNNYFDFFSTSSAIVIQTGTTTTIRVTPVQHVTAEGLRAFSIEKRMCRYLDENEKATIFNYYTYKSCMFECKLRNVIGVLNCTDWKLPISPDWINVPLCTAAVSYTHLTLPTTPYV